MTIVVVCSHCGSQFTLKAEVAGRTIRCPNGKCRKPFEAVPLSAVPAAPPPPPKPKPKSNSKKVGEVLPVYDMQFLAPPPPPPPPANLAFDDEMPAFADAEPEEVEPLPPPPPPPPKKSQPQKPPPKVIEAVVVPPTPPKVIEAVVVSSEVIEAVVVPPAPPKVIEAVVVSPKPPKPPKAPTAAPKIVEAVVVPPPAPKLVEAAVVEPAGPKEVVWTPDADVPGESPAAEPEAAAEEPIFIPRRRKKKSKLPVYLLIGMASIIIIAIGYAVLIGLKTISDAEGQLAKEAESQYKAGEYGAAAKSYGQLVGDFPDSNSRSKYEFFAELAALQRDVRSVTTRDEPLPAIAKLTSFIDARKDSPLMKSDGGDVVAAGRKVVEDTAGHAEDRIKDYRKDRSQSTQLKRAEDAVKHGRELLAKLDPLRGSSEEPFDGLRLRFDQIAGDIDTEHRRTRGLTEIRELLARPTDASVEAARAKLAEYGLSGDGEALGLVNEASGMLGRLVRYAPNPAAPVAPPKTWPASVAFAAPIGATIPNDAVRPEDRKPGVFLAHAKGIAYALDDDTGDLLWAARLGSGTTFAPAVAEGPGYSLAVVVSNVAGQPAVAGHDLRTGAVRWYQPLPAPPAGSPLVVGQRVYAPLRDLDGTLVEVDLTNGHRLGVLSLGQVIGPPPFVRAGTGLIYVTADARRVYVLDAAARDIEGRLAPPRCVQVLLTGHGPNTVRTPPLILGPTGDTPAERWLLLSQQAAPNEMRLRPFALPPLAPPSADGGAPPGIVVGAAATIMLPGVCEWPTSDGERLALVTDAGELRLFGVNQPGNRDAALFPIPQQLPTLSANGPPTPGMAIPSDDGGYWMLANGGDVQLVRVDLNPEKGQVASVVPRPTPAGKATFNGIPVQPFVMNPRTSTAFLVVRSTESNAVRAVAFDTANGEVRWQRQLGLDTAAASDGTLAGESGAIQRVPESSTAIELGTLHRSEATNVLAAPFDSTSGRTFAAVSTDGSTRCILTNYRKKNEEWLAVRLIANGRSERSGRVRIESPPIGKAVLIGNTALYPARDGFVYRATWPDTVAKDEDGFERIAVVRGPQWRSGENRNASGTGMLTQLDGERIAVADGDRTIAVWLWPNGGAAQPTGIRWALPQTIAIEPAFLPARNEQPASIIIADTSGTVWQFATDRAGDPLQRWKPDGKLVPLGRPTAGFVVQPAANGERNVLYVVDHRHIAMLRLDGVPSFSGIAVRGEDKAERTIVGIPQPAPGGRWLVTDLGGRVSLIDPLNPPGDNQVSLRSEVNLPGMVPVAPGTMLGSNRVLVPLSDGTAVVLMLPEK